MKKSLLIVAAMAAIGASTSVAEETYNYFDAADCDADGWLWFDSQAKLDKYVGFGSTYKIQLQACGYEAADLTYPEPWTDPELPGYNADGEEGGTGAKFGAIVLNACSSSLGSDNPNGGGFMMWLPDCAQMDAFLSCENGVIQVGLKAGMGAWVQPVDCAKVKTWWKMGTWIKPLAEAYQYTFDNIQSYKNENSPYTTIASPKGTKVTALFTNNGKELYVQGLRVRTYTNVSASTPVISSDDSTRGLQLVGDYVTSPVSVTFTVTDAAGATVARATGLSISLADLPAGAYVVCGGGHALKVLR